VHDKPRPAARLQPSHAAPAPTELPSPQTLQHRSRSLARSTQRSRRLTSRRWHGREHCSLAGLPSRLPSRTSSESHFIFRILTAGTFITPSLPPWRHPQFPQPR
jgi:hypothetical protein